MKSSTLHSRACADVHRELTKEKTIATPALLLVSGAQPCRATWGPLHTWGLLAGLCSPALAAQPATAALAALCKYQVHPQRDGEAIWLSDAGLLGDAAETSLQPTIAGRPSVRLLSVPLSSEAQG